MSAGNDVWGDRSSDGPPRPFFGSRWVAAPAHVRELEPDAGLPAGFRAAGVVCGIKPSGNHDLGLLICDAARPVSAARFTASGTAAAPVLLSRERCRLDALRAVLANSGCANAATGKRGLDDAAKTQGAAALAMGVQPEEVLLGSTGGISWYLPVDARAEGDPRRQRAVAPRGGHRLPEGDSDDRRLREARQPRGAAALGDRAPHRPVQGGGHDLAELRHDAVLRADRRGAEPHTAELLLGVCVKRSFDRCTVDGDLSTNDTAVLMASGASGVTIAPESEDELRFGEALDALLRQLAIMMVTDGEGAARIARVVVRGGSVGEGRGALEMVEAAARGVANSPLVKAALHSADPNWGRLVMAVGAALPGTAPLPVDVAIEGILVCSAGTAIDYDEDALARAIDRREVAYEVTLGGDSIEAETEVFFSDLSHEYVRINAEYTT